MGDQGSSGRAAEALRKRAEALHGRYVFRFADKPRATRDIGEFDLLLREAAALADEVSALPTGVSAELRKLTTDNLALYRDEREAVSVARAAGPDHALAALLGTRANFAIGRYERHFAGQDRRTRDVGLLDEVLEELSAIQRQMAHLLSRADLAELRNDLEVVTENVGLYSHERETILEAQRPAEPDQRAGTLATLANRQFELYKVHFAGQSRTTRRQGLLERMIADVERVLGAMRAVTVEGFDDDAHRRNEAIVGERLSVYRRELEAIEETQRGLTVFARVEELGREADRILDAYNDHFAGQDRVTRDPSLLNLLCDRMGDIERQVTALSDRYDLGLDHGPFGLIRDALGMFEREYRAVRQARLN